MKGPLRGFTIAVTGDFGEQRGHDKIRQWIHVNGGSFAHGIRNEVTHLVCSTKHFKTNIKMVRQARAFRSINIVSFDWLEDSLMKHTPLSARNYMLENIVKAKFLEKTRKRVKKKENIDQGMEQFEKGCTEFKEDMKTDGYEIYRDIYDNFAYDITLARANLLINENERYQLKLYTTHTAPKMFACFVKYSAPGNKSWSRVLAPTGSSWETAWAAFEQFFKLKTRKEWAMRFYKYEMGKEAPSQEKNFNYSSPAKGEPRGCLWG
ncbi:hypothetical protein MMC21_000107 [Puttea exsequens]|nr:hypothetical protein [Puttea exsequens]